MNRSERRKRWKRRQELLDQYGYVQSSDKWSEYSDGWRSLNQNGTFCYQASKHKV